MSTASTQMKDIVSRVATMESFFPSYARFFLLIKNNGDCSFWKEIFKVYNIVRNNGGEGLGATIPRAGGCAALPVPTLHIRHLYIYYIQEMHG